MRIEVKLKLLNQKCSCEGRSQIEALVFWIEVVWVEVAKFKLQSFGFRQRIWCCSLVEWCRVDLICADWSAEVWSCRSKAGLVWIKVADQKLAQGGLKLPNWKLPILSCSRAKLKLQSWEGLVVASRWLVRSTDSTHSSFYMRSFQSSYVTLNQSQHCFYYRRVVGMIHPGQRTSKTIGMTATWSSCLSCSPTWASCSLNVSIVFSWKWEICSDVIYNVAHVLHVNFFNYLGNGVVVMGSTLQIHWSNSGRVECIKGLSTAFHTHAHHKLCLHWCSLGGLHIRPTKCSCFVDLAKGSGGSCWIGKGDHHVIHDLFVNKRGCGLLVPQSTMVLSIMLMMWPFMPVKEVWTITHKRG